MWTLALALFIHAAAEGEAPAPAVEPAAVAEPAAEVKTEQRFDHHGAVGLLLGVSGLRKEASGSGLENTWRGALNVGASFNVGWASNEIIVMASVSLARTETKVGTETQYGLGVDGQLWGGFRGYFGDRWKTYFDLDLALNVVPGFTVGPRVGIGLQYELSSLAGIFATLGAQLGFGSALVFRAELMIGVQLRSFLLED